MLRLGIPAIYERLFPGQCQRHEPLFSLVLRGPDVLGTGHYA